MTANNALKLQQYRDGFPLPGCWKLAPERAVTLNPTEAGVLRIAQGRVWATLDGPHQGPANDWGDVVLRSGEQLRLLPGQQVVVEPFGDAVNEPAYFSWEPSAAWSQAVPGVASSWHDVLARPPAHADDGIRMSLRAAGRMGSAVRALLRHFVAGRGRVMSPLESNQP